MLDTENERMSRKDTASAVQKPTPELRLVPRGKGDPETPKLLKLLKYSRCVGKERTLKYLK